MSRCLKTTAMMDDGVVPDNTVSVREVIKEWTVGRGLAATAQDLHTEGAKPRIPLYQHWRYARTSLSFLGWTLELNLVYTPNGTWILEAFQNQPNHFWLSVPAVGVMAETLIPSSVHVMPSEWLKGKVCVFIWGHSIIYQCKWHN